MDRTPRFETVGIGTDYLQESNSESRTASLGRRLAQTRGLLPLWRTHSACRVAIRGDIERGVNPLL